MTLILSLHDDTEDKEVMFSPHPGDLGSISYLKHGVISTIYVCIISYSRITLRPPMLSKYGTVPSHNYEIHYESYNEMCTMCL